MQPPSLASIGEPLRPIHFYNGSDILIIDSCAETAKQTNLFFSAIDVHWI